MPIHPLRPLPLAALLALGACTSQAPAPRLVSASPPPPVQKAPAPVALSPIHSSVTEAERVWHLRAALNVAALSCTSQKGPAIARNYNQLLARHARPLSDAYAVKVARYQKAAGKGWQRAMDQDMTRLYNHWAWPLAQQQFCDMADGIARRAVSLPPNEFSGYALGALAELDAPIARSRSGGTRLVSTPAAALQPSRVR
jgi:hypothetical protein